MSVPPPPADPGGESADDPTPDIRILRGDATIAVVGLGYVGLPAAAAFLATGQRVLGFDRDPEKLARIARGDGYLRHIPDGTWRELAASDRFEGTTDPRRFREADAIVLCVPTPLGDGREPDLSYVTASARAVSGHLPRGALVVLASTSYPGTTREVLAPILLEDPSTGRPRTLGRDVRIAFAPEREDPGRSDTPAVDIPRIVGGLDPTSGELAHALYARAYRTVDLVGSAEVAESAKILENVYRAVNIALVNEMKLILERMGIDIWEVVAAASSKPYGFQAFHPGPGLGGHCIPIDPFYLTWRAAQVGAPTRFIELAGEINTAMPEHVVGRIESALVEDGVPVAGARVLVLGIAYKPEVDDTRETPAAEIIARLRALGAAVEYHDPYVPEFPPMRRHEFDLASVPLTEERLVESDAVVVVTDHRAIDWDLVAAHAPRIIDTRNALAGRSVRGKLLKA